MTGKFQTYHELKYYASFYCVRCQHDKHCAVVLVHRRALATADGRILELLDYLIPREDDWNGRCRMFLPTDSFEDRSIRVGDLVLDANTKRFSTGERDAQLSRVEFELMHYLMRNAGRICSWQELMRYVWSYPITDDDTNADRTLPRVHIGNIREKIEEDRKKPKVILTIKGHGYMIPKEEQ